MSITNIKNEKSQASSFSGGLAFFVFLVAARQRNNLINNGSIAPTIETSGYRLLFLFVFPALTEKRSKDTKEVFIV